MAKTGKMFKQLRWGARSAGENVVLNIGNADIEISYETAFQMSQALRVAAKEAKMTAGDISRHWSILATLRDVSANYKKFVKPNLRFSNVKDIGGGT